MRIEIDLNKSIEENASDYYDRTKKQKRKLEGAKDAISDTISKINKLNQDHQKLIEQLDKKTEKLNFHLLLSVVTTKTLVFGVLENPKIFDTTEKCYSSQTAINL